MRADQLLDRPIWSALTTRQAAFALGDARAVRMAPDYGMFAATPDVSPSSLEALAALAPASGALFLMEAAQFPPIPGLTAAVQPVWQMVAGDLAPAAQPRFDIVPLSEADAPQMLALTTLTEPGPFFTRTHQLGDFVGVKHEGRLVAMAGERLRPPGFTEVSGVCTHPDHRGRGYAAGLMRQVAQRIAGRGETPILHVLPRNTAAIALYRALGFELRREVTLTVLSRGEAAIPGHGHSEQLPPDPTRR
jgi:predicted GNAT family acetyltransferase